MVNKATLDRLFSRGCAMPGCTSSECGHMKMGYLHSRCHTDAPQFLRRAGGKLIAECILPECRKETCSFTAIDVTLNGESSFDGHLFAQGCHPESAVWLSYEVGSGVLKVECYECRNIAAEIKIG